MTNEENMNEEKVKATRVVSQEMSLYYDIIKINTNRKINMDNGRL